MKLVIVESPNKCHTISRYLGEGYVVMATKGHIRDLATSGKGGFGVDIENDFKAKYVVSKAKISTVRELKEAAARADEVILATDPDREGEAIAWHLAEILDLDIKTNKRLEFHEITRSSIEEAIENPRTIDMNLVESQETRRIIDRIIGFRLSNIIQKKIKSKSAGRVQSATLKLICDHSDEIAKFVPEEYWSLSLDLKNGKNTLNASFVSYNDVKKIENKSINDEILSKIGKQATVVEIKKTTKTVESKPAFTTSTLQQEAFNAYKFSTSRTQQIAQSLYEGIKIDDEEVGLVTYIRTDSTYLSDTYCEKTSSFIEERFGKEYVGKRKIVKVNGAQNAHEAIRPTSNHRFPSVIKSYLTSDQYRLYKLIYERAIGSLMSPKKESVTSIILESNGVRFKLEGTSILFDGYEKISLKKSDSKSLPDLKVGDVIDIVNINNEQKFTEPPALYSEAKIVKLMEEKGIGRPSTYSSTIQTLFKRKYTESKDGLMNPTEQGMLTSVVLNKYFPAFVSAKYTADMEKELDQIQEGEITRSEVLNDFYTKFTKEADSASKLMYKEKDQGTGRKCPKCGHELVIKQSKYGEFIGCSNYPECDYREKEENLEYTGEMCPKCGKPLVYRYNSHSKHAKKFIACSGYPDCDYIKNDGQPQAERVVVKKCPVCGGDMVERKSGKKTFLGCSNYPRCKHIEQIKK